MRVIEAFLRMSTGRYVWIDVPSSEPMIGKVESFDEAHVLLSCELGIFCVAIESIASAHLAKQVEIVAP